MTKSLEALEKIKQAEYFVDFEQDAKIKDDYKTELAIIEKELKRLEELEKAFVVLSKDDEKAKKLLSKEIEKNRAFEIIKNRIIDMHDFLIYDTYSSFNQIRTLRGLTPISKEEYKLLKEVLLWVKV